jgi:ATP-dependent DNA ligase
MIDDARPSEMPGFIRPQLATLKSKAPKGDQWLHEIKFDGYRVQIHINKGKRQVYTRNGLDWTKRFSRIAGALDIPGQAIIDGEVVVVERKQRLLDLIGENGIERPVLSSEHLTRDGQHMFEHAAKLGWEGIFSKRGPWRRIGPPKLRNELPTAFTLDDLTVTAAPGRRSAFQPFLTKNPDFR